MTDKKESYQDKLKRQFQPLEDYQNMAHKWRGQIINWSIDLEQAIEIFIARHFTLGKTQETYQRRMTEFKRMFFWETNMKFADKIKIVKNLIEINHPEFTQLDHLENYYDELIEIIKCRNNMAHWQLDFSQDYRWNGAKDKKFKINKLKEGTEKIYTEAEINRITDLCRKYIATFYNWTHVPFEDVLSP